MRLSRPDLGYCAIKKGDLFNIVLSGYVKSTEQVPCFMYLLKKLLVTYLVKYLSSPSNESTI